jgi:diacylglycerol kinase family enzyme
MYSRTTNPAPYTSLSITENHCRCLPVIVVGNASYYAYEVPMNPDARMDDGMLDLCIFAEEHALDRLSQIGAVFTGQHLKHARVSRLRAKHVHIEADPPIHLQLDGDPAGASPVEISVLPSALHIVTPQDGETSINSKSGT